MTLMAVNCQDKIFIAMDDYLCFEGPLAATEADDIPPQGLRDFWDLA